MATGRVVLTADTTALQTGLTRAQGYVRSFAASASSSLMGLFAVGAVIGQFNGLRNELDRIGKLAERGFSTDFLQDLGATADLAGASLEQAVKGFSRLVGEINRAGTPSQELRDGLAKIGMTVDELRGMAPERVFEIVAARIGSMSNESDKLAAVTGVLGSRYADLIPLLNQYAESGLENVAKASAEQIARTEEFNDSLKRLGQTLKGVMIPILDLITKAFAGVNASMQAMGATTGGIANFFDKLRNGIGPVQAMREAFAETKTEIEKIAQGLYGAPGAGASRGGAPSGIGAPTNTERAAREQAMLDTQKRAADETERRLKAEQAIAETRRKMEQDAEEFGKTDMEIAEIRMRRARETRMNARMGSGADIAEADAAATDIEASAQALLLRERERLMGADFSPARANVSEIQRIGGGGGVGVGMERVVKVGEDQLATLGRIENLLTAIRSENGGF
jgi:hypothetical protein